MIPLRDDVPSQRYPIMTVTLILLNIVAFVFELSLGRHVQEFIMSYGVVPVRYAEPGIAKLFTWREQLVPLVSSMFLHGGWTHLIGNMWTLWIFGDNVEDRLGRRRFVVLYLLGGIAAALLHIFTNASSPVAVIGASGAIAAVMGAYLRLYPRANVAMVIPPFLFGPFFEVPAVLFLGWWFILQFFNGTLSLMTDPNKAGGIAWWAHVGGFIFGAMLCSVIKVKHFYRRHHEEDFRW